MKALLLLVLPWLSPANYTDNLGNLHILYSELWVQHSASSCILFINIYPSYPSIGEQRSCYVYSCILFTFKTHLFVSAFRALMHICILLPMLTFGSSLEESGCSSLLWKQPVSCFLMLWSLVAVALKRSRASRLCFMLSRTVGMLQSGTAAWHLCLYLVLFSSMCVSVSLLYWLEQYSIWTHKRVFFTHPNTVCAQPVWALGRL